MSSLNKLGALMAMVATGATVGGSALASSLPSDSVTRAAPNAMKQQELAVLRPPQAAPVLALRQDTAPPPAPKELAVFRPPQPDTNTYSVDVAVMRPPQPDTTVYA